MEAKTLDGARGAEAILERARRESRRALSEAEGKALLAYYGLRVPGAVVGRDAAEAAAKAAGLTPPFAVKVVSPEILHKSDAGGVALHVTDVAAAVEEMAAKPAIAAAVVEGWLVEEMAPEGQEVAIGGVRDPQFGPMLMVGLGGVFVELLKDVSFRLCPIDVAEAEAMLAELKGAALLEGARGRAPVDKRALIDAMMALGGEDGLLMRHRDVVAEADLNPIIVSERGAVAADARVLLVDAPAPAGRGEAESAETILARFEPLFRPKTVAVLGASTSSVAIANTFIRRLTAFGYKGAVYPIHPKAAEETIEVEGLPAYPSLAAAPEPVDYAYVAIASERIPDALAAAEGRCRIAQVISSGFGEVSAGRDLEAELVSKARGAGVRVLGPNCLGTYSPRGGLTFPSDAPTEPGAIGVVAQSGGLSTDIVKRGQWRGLRYSGLVTIGNSADLTPVDLLEFYLHDPETKAIGLYLEDVKEGRAFFELMRSSAATKPVVILRGGRSDQGRAAAASHTGALAGGGEAWRALSLQTPCALVGDVDGFIDALLALQHLTLRPGRPTRRVCLFGNGGGASVLGTDAFAEAGLDVSPFEAAARAPLEALGLPPGTSVANPIDTPVRTLQEKDGFVAGEILELVYRHAKPDAIAMHLNLAAFVGRGESDPLENLLTVIEQAQGAWPGAAHFTLALRSDGSPQLDDAKRRYRARAAAANVPVFDEIPAMAKALSVVAHLEGRLG